MRIIVATLVKIKIFQQHKNKHRINKSTTFLTSTVKSKLNCVYLFNTKREVLI